MGYASDQSETFYTFINITFANGNTYGVCFQGSGANYCMRYISIKDGIY